MFNQNSMYISNASLLLKSLLTSGQYLNARGQFEIKTLSKLKAAIFRPLGIRAKV